MQAEFRAERGAEGERAAALLGVARTGLGQLQAYTALEGGGRNWDLALKGGLP